MASIKNVGSKVQIEIDRLDGGYNVKDSKSRIGLFESPDCKNVIFSDTGDVETRQGTSYFNTSTAEVGTNAIDGITSYNGTMVVWAGGQMLRASGTTFTQVTAASGGFDSGARVAYEQFQSILFCSDGANGPWRWEGGENFYNMGIDTLSAPTAGSDGAGDVAADTYYYAVSAINTHAVEGEVGSASAGATLVGSAQVLVENIPVGATIQGVNKRNIYRATSTTGPWLFVKELGDNVTTSFTDNIGVGSEGAESIDDGNSPKPFTTIRLHRERLFMDDSDNRTLLRYTEYQNPFISEALSFEPLNKGDGSNITALGVQDDLLTAFKGNSIWLGQLSDPSDDSTWGFVKSPANQGITGPRALLETDNGILFVGKRNGRITGFHLISGIDVLETSNRILRTKSISEKVEADVLLWPSSVYDDIAMVTYDNRVFIAAPASSTSTRLDGLLWFDINRLGTEGQPGSWAPWTGIVGCNDFIVFNGNLYGGSSDTDGHVIQFNNGTYTDADGSAIDSYFWTKEFGGEAAIESWIKDWRWVNIWYLRVGGYYMNMQWRIDGGSGNITTVNLTPSQNVWANTPPGGETGTALIWSSGSSDDDANNLWAGPIADLETQHSVGPLTGRRIQIGFDNQNTAGQRFKIHSLKLLANLRRQR